MRARRFEVVLAVCSCGQRPCIHKQQVGDGFKYFVSCTRCGLATEKAEWDHAAYADWNEGKVMVPLSAAG